MGVQPPTVEAAKLNASGASLDAPIELSLMLELSRLPFISAASWLIGMFMSEESAVSLKLTC